MTVPVKVAAAAARALSDGETRKRAFGIVIAVLLLPLLPALMLSGALQDALWEMESMEMPEIEENPEFRAALGAAGLDGERIELAVLLRSLCPDPGPEKDEAFLASLPEDGNCGDEDLFRAAGTAYGLELTQEDREALLSLRDDAQNEIRNTETGKENEHERNGQGNG